MVDTAVFVLILAAALGCALIAGTFFAFSTFVMPALARLPPAQGIVAMQTINVTVLHPSFLGVFIGTAAACALLTGHAVWHFGERGSGWLLAGSLAYIAGTFAVTRIFNIPRNNVLAALGPDDAAAWSDFQRGWNRWNHVRGAAALAACALLVGALVERA
jgi:uncharacterized membrane protein